MNILLDTNIILNIVRSKYRAKFLTFLNPNDTTFYISVVNEAEIKSIAIKNKWEFQRILILEDILDKIKVIEVSKLLVNTYVEIDSYSQRLNYNF